MEKKEKQTKRKTNYLWAYYKPILILMLLVMLPMAVFLLLLPKMLLLAPRLLFVMPFFYIIYIPILLYWFLKKSRFYKEWKNAAILWGMQRSKEFMKDIRPEIKKEMMKQFRERHGKL